MKFKKLINKSKLMLLTCAALSSFATAGWAATYYVDSVSGADSNAGSQTAPWKTLSKVNSIAFKGGDTILFKRGGVWGDVMLLPSSGTSAAPVTYGAYGSGNKPLIRGFYASGKSYATAQDIEFRNGGTSGTDYPARISGSHHISLKNCDIIADATNGAWATLYIVNNSNYNQIISCNIKNLNLSRQSDAVNLRRDASYNLIMDNNIGTATHYSLSLEGSSAAYPNAVCSYNVIKNNVIYNPEGATMGLQSNSNNNLVEGNIISGGKATSFDVNLPRSLKSVSLNNIIRHNILRDNPGSTASGLTSEVYQYQTDPPNIAAWNHVYNNLVTNMGQYGIALTTNGDPGASAHHNYYKNNISYNNVKSYQLATQNSSAIYDNYFANNLFYKPGVSTVLLIKGAAATIAGVQSSDSAHFWGNIQQDPKLDANLHPLADSPCIDGGDYLTKVTSASGTGSTFTVADAGYFFDGFGVVPGDSIRVGAATATVVSINYANNTISVAETIGWKTGDPVSLPYNGAKPDIGPFEFGSYLPPPLSLQVLN